MRVLLGIYLHARVEKKKPVTPFFAITTHQQKAENSRIDGICGRGHRAPALTRHTLFTQSWPTKAGSMEEERRNGQKVTNAGGETARERVCGWSKRGVRGAGGRGGFIRNHLREQAEIGGGEKIKDAAAATKTRCRYQRRTVAFLPPLRRNSPLKPEAVGFSVIAPSTVVKRAVWIKPMCFCIWPRDRATLCYLHW